MVFLDLAEVKNSMRQLWKNTFLQLPPKEKTFLIELEKIRKISFHGFSSSEHTLNLFKDIQLEKRVDLYAHI